MHWSAQPHSLYSLVPSKYIYSTASWSGNRFYILNISLKNSQLVRSQGWCLRGFFNHLKINLGEVSFEDIYQEFFCTGHMKNTKCTHISNYQYKNYRTQILHPLKGKLFSHFEGFRHILFDIDLDRNQMSSQVNLQQ